MDKPKAACKLISYGSNININYTDSREKTAVLYAAENQHWRVLDKLRRKGANFNIIDNNGYSVIDYLHLENEKITNFSDKQHKVLAKCFDIVAQAGFNINTLSIYDEPSITWASRFSLYETIGVLVKHKADLTFRDLVGCTPLHNVCVYNKEDEAIHGCLLRCVALLLLGNANISALDDDRQLASGYIAFPCKSTCSICPKTPLSLLLRAAGDNEFYTSIPEVNLELITITWLRKYLYLTHRKYKNIISRQII